MHAWLKASNPTSLYYLINLDKILNVYSVPRIPVLQLQLLIINCVAVCNLHAYKNANARMHYDGIFKRTLITS